jgi:hypothetical protein
MTTRLRPWFAAACAAAGLAALAAPAAADCPPAAPTGLFQGSATKPDAERVDVTLNLACADGRYIGQFFTSQGDFTASDVAGDAGHVVFRLPAAAGQGGELKVDGDALAGTLVSEDDRLTMSLRRAGPALALDALRPTLDLTTEQWREDLQAFAAELPKRHANAFFHQPKAVFDAVVGRLDRRLDQLNNDEIFINLQRLANGVGDGHTGIVLPLDSQRLPIQIARFGPEGRPELRIVAAGAGLERALGAQIVRVGSLPVAEAWRRVLLITPQDELPALREGSAVGLMSRGLVLHGLNIAPERTHAVFTLRDEAGRTFRLDIAALAPGKPLQLTQASKARGPAQQNRDKPFWCQALEDRRALYCAFNGYQDIGRGSLEMLGLIEETHPGKLIVDMRNNGGGDNTLGYGFIVKPLMARADLNQKGRLYVLVGPLTFSAAMNNAAQFQDQTRAILVGQQIGEKPNSYQEPRQFRLPNSHLVVRASTRFYRFRETGPNAVTPDKTIAPTWADVKAGRDPVLDWVLAQPAP